MALPDFTGQNIQDTYQRVLQTDSGTLRDGTADPVPVFNCIIAIYYKYLKSSSIYSSC